MSGSTPGSATESASKLAARIAEQLAACSTEPIHIPGAIQPHGYLCTVDADSMHVLQCSDNLRAALSAPSDAPRTEGNDRAIVRDLLGAELHEAITKAVQRADLARPYLLGTFSVAGDRHDALVHRSGESLVVELERATAASGEAFAAIQSLVRALATSVQQPATVTALCEFAAREMHAITGFGRTLVYRFDEEGHGEVLAECRDDGYDSYLGHRFPASDIPSQARALYRRNPIRLIPDATYRPVPLTPPLHPRTSRPTDLTFAGLRSVSPVHLEYMRNMGTLASMSVSIIVKDRLWGLISCHDANPRHLPYPMRLAAEHLGQLVSLRIESQESVGEVEHSLTLRQLLVSMVSASAERGGALAALADMPDALLRFGDATGAAVVEAGHVRTVGITPDAAAIEQLTTWLASLGSEIFATDHLGREFPPAMRYAAVGSGMLAMSVSQIHRHFVLWFRAEEPQTVLWAGNPNKATATEAGDAQLHPRHSFATWREELTGRSTPWRASELRVAGEFRNALLNLVLRRAEEVAALAGELGRINKELEAFSYSVSHDLRAPLRHITGYADLVREYESSTLSERGHRYLQNIKEAARFAGTLVDDLLAFSQMGRSTLRPSRVDLNALVASIIRHRGMEGGTSIEWVVGELPAVVADPVFMQVVMQNLIDNAVKYSAKRDRPRIEISGSENDEACTVRVADNGVGFDMRYVGKLFGVFQRLHGVEEFSGTGIGLASVRRAVERHGGSVVAHGELDRGATFTFSLPRTTVPDATHPNPTDA